LTEKECHLNDLLDRALKLVGNSRPAEAPSAWQTEYDSLKEAAGREAFDPQIKSSRKAPEGRNFPFAKARRWRNKTIADGATKPKEFKVLPWFQPIDNESRIDFKCLLKDLMPEMSDDMLAEFDVYSGLMLHVGWQIHNDAGMWLCLQKNLQDQFEDLGDWKDEDGKEEPPFPLTEKSIKEKEEREKANAK
jgi:hypothetical protein